MVTPRHETPKESFQLSEGVIPAFAATDARAPRPDVKNESFAIEVVAVARDLNLARGKKVLCHIRSDPPADPPQILASERTADPAQTRSDHRRSCALAPGLHQSG